MTKAAAQAGAKEADTKASPSKSKKRKGAKRPPRRVVLPAGLEHALTAEQAAEQCGVNLSTLWAWRTRGVLVGDKRVRLADLRLGKAVYIEPSAIVDFMRQCGSTPAGAN
jgi:hypothetical protein